MTDTPRRIEVQFDTTGLRVLAAEGEGEARRTISGMAVPWDVPATTMFGERVEFAKDSISVQGVPVILHHAPDRPIGAVKGESSSDTGLEASAKISAVRDGDEALVLAGDGVLRGFSVGVNPTEWTFNEDTDTLRVIKGETDHLALVVSPAFAEAQGDLKVAASAASTKEGAAVTDTAAKTEQSAPEAPAVVASAPRTPTVKASMPTIGEVMQAYASIKRNPEQFAAMQARVQAATGHVLEADFSGLAETPIFGDIIDLAAPAERPVSEAFGVFQGPSGVKSFVRPKMTGHLADAATAPEKSDVTDDGLDTDGDTVTMAFIKRAANVSAEAQAFSSPDVYGIVARDLVRAYLRGFEAKTVTALEAGTYNSTVIDQGTFVEDMHIAAANIYDGFFPMPDLMVCASDVWSKIGGMVDTEGRPLFPYLAPQNAAGSNTAGVTGFGLNVLGLRPVVSRTLTPGTAYLASSEAFEVYESSRVDMGPVQDPTVLGHRLGDWRGCRHLPGGRRRHREVHAGLTDGVRADEAAVGAGSNRARRTEAERSRSCCC